MSKSQMASLAVVIGAALVCILSVATGPDSTVQAQDPNPCMNVTNSATSGQYLTANGAGTAPPCKWASGVMAYAATGTTAATGATGATGSAGPTMQQNMHIIAANFVLGVTGYVFAFGTGTTFTAANTYWCVATDNSTTASAVNVSLPTTTGVTLYGTAGHVVTLICAGY